MKEFLILARDSWCNKKDGGRARCLVHDTNAFYNEDYLGGGGRWCMHGTIENLICTFKNDITPYNALVLQKAKERLYDILKVDIPQILQIINSDLIRICVVPRAKRETAYRDDQKLFRTTIQQYIKIFHVADGRIDDGTLDIKRFTDTKTTHLSRNGNDGGGSGDLPYIGITKETCTISDDVIGKNILLIDDLYTRTVCIDEDCIQALYDKGANKVFFYSIGKTVYRKEIQQNNIINDETLFF